MPRPDERWRAARPRPPYFGDERDAWTVTGGPRNEQRVRVGGYHAARIALTTI